MHIRIPFTVTLKSDLAHGGDGRKGIGMPFRRKKQLLKTQSKFESYFTDDDNRRNAVALTLFRIYQAIGDKARMSIRNEFSDAVEFASYQQTIQGFLESLTTRLEIDLNRVKDSGNYEKLGLIDLFGCFVHDLDFLIPIRREHQYIMLLVFKMKDVESNNYEYLQAEKKEASEGLKLFETGAITSKAPLLYNSFIDDVEARTWAIKEAGEKTTVALSGKADLVPYYSGNAFKGICRRLLMEDFYNLVFVGSGKTISETAYHRWFTGGSIKSSTDTEEVDRKRTMRELCPPLALLGSAVESGTIESCATFGELMPNCVELGTGEMSFYELTQAKFGTRLDSLKTEANVDVEREPKDPKKKEAATQMYYLYEVMTAGATLNAQLTITTRDPIALSCFARMLTLLKQSGFLGAKNTVGNGEVEYEGLEMPEGVTEDAYLEFLAANKDKILAYKW